MAHLSFSWMTTTAGAANPGIPVCEPDLVAAKPENRRQRVAKIRGAGLDIRGAGRLPALFRRLRGGTRHRFRGIGTLICIFFASTAR